MGTREETLTEKFSCIVFTLHAGSWVSVLHEAHGRSFRSADAMLEIHIFFGFPHSDV